MITVTSAELYTWVASFLWPLTRILGVIAVAPLFGNINVPARVKVGLSIMLALIIAPGVPAVPALDPMSLTGLLILVQQLIIGVAMGFAIRVMFAGVEMAGDIISMTMGLGFAVFYDPQTRGRSSAISQFVALLTLMVYLTTNLHLLLLSALAQSFESLPITTDTISSAGFHQMAEWGGRIFSVGVQMSLPIIAALLVTNMALGILTRAAPQLNLFGIGFPITISVGLLMLALSLPYLTTPLVNLMHEGIGAVRQITGSFIPPPR